MNIVHEVTISNIEPTIDALGVASDRMRAIVPPNAKVYTGMGHRADKETATLVARWEVKP